MKYLKSKKGSLESSILSVWTEAAKKVNEKLVGGQKKLDKDKDGDIDGKDFAMLRKEKGKKKVDELTKAQKKLPPALQKAIKKKEKNENYEVGTKARRDHTIETTPGQSKEDFEKQVEVMHKKKNSMREALAKMWGIDEENNRNPFDEKITRGTGKKGLAKSLDKLYGKKKDKKDKKEGKTLTGKPETNIEVEPKMEKKK
tara:strand:+ start:47 stop:646 length:600 start_codon:yes stop_codon:yes gene_type:complete